MRFNRNQLPVNTEHMEFSVISYYIKCNKLKTCIANRNANDGWLLCSTLSILSVCRCRCSDHGYEVACKTHKLHRNDAIELLLNSLFTEQRRNRRFFLFFCICVSTHFRVSDSCAKLLCIIIAHLPHARWKILMTCVLCIKFGSSDH